MSAEVDWQAADGSGVPEMLVRPLTENRFPTGFSPDGTTLFAIAWDGSGTTHLWRAPSVSEIEGASLARPAKKAESKSFDP